MRLTAEGVSQVGDGREWLLQTQPPGEGDMGGSSEDPGSPVDPCLKISDGSRSCQSGESGSPGGRTVTGRGDDTGVPYTILVTTVPGAVAVQVTLDGETDRVEMVEVPGGRADRCAGGTETMAGSEPDQASNTPALESRRTGGQDHGLSADAPGTDARAAVVIGDDLVGAPCVDDLRPEPTGPRTAVVVDPAGLPVGCPPP